MKAYLLIAIMILTIFASGCQNQFVPIPNQQPAQPEQPIGGQRDSHGCLGPAGYSWDAEIQACTRSFEIKEQNDIKAAKIAVDALGSANGLTIVSVEAEQCNGCYAVKTDTLGIQKTVSLVNWAMSDIN